MHNPVRVFAILSMLIWSTSLFFSSLSLFGAGAFKYLGDPSFFQIFSEISLYQFLHGGILHLVSNVFFLFYFERLFSSILKPREIWIFFLGNTIFVYIAIILFSKGITIGISGFCMAMLAYIAMWMQSVKHPDIKGAYSMLAINILIGFTGNISLVGHAAGAIFGIVFFYGRKFLLKHM